MLKMHFLLCLSLLCLVSMANIPMMMMTPMKKEKPNANSNEIVTAKLKRSPLDLGVLPPEYLARKIIFQCDYFVNMSSTCQTVNKCKSHLNGQMEDIGNKWRIYRYSCTGLSNQQRWSITDGVLKEDLVQFVNTNPKVARPLFNCAFFSEDDANRSDNKPTGKLQLFECHDSQDCNTPGSETNCAGSTPWNGAWTGDLKTGLRGSISSVSQEDPN